MSDYGAGAGSCWWFGVCASGRSVGALFRTRTSSVGRVLCLPFGVRYAMGWLTFDFGSRMHLVRWCGM